MYARTMLFLLFCATLQSIRLPMLWGVNFILPALFCAGVVMNRGRLFVCSCIVAGGLAWTRGALDPVAMIYLVVPLMVHRNTVTYTLLRDYYLLLCVLVCAFVMPVTALMHGQEFNVAILTGIKNAAAAFVLMTIFLFVIIPWQPVYSRSRGYGGSVL